MSDVIKGSDVILSVRKEKVFSKEVFGQLEKILAQGTKGQVTSDIVKASQNIGNRIGEIVSKGTEAVDRMLDMIKDFIPVEHRDGIISQILEFIEKLTPSDEYIPVGCQRNMTITKTAETIETTSKKSKYREYIQSYPNAEISCDGVMFANEEAYRLINKAYDNREPIYIEILRDMKPYERGMAIISSIEETSAYDDVATYAITLQVSNELERI